MRMYTRRARARSASDGSYKFAREDFRIRLVAYLATRMPMNRARFPRVPRIRTPYHDREIRLEGFVHTDDVWVAHIDAMQSYTVTSGEGGLVERRRMVESERKNRAGEK